MEAKQMANARQAKKSNLWKWLLGCGCAVALMGILVIGGVVWYGMKSFTTDPAKAKEIGDSIVKFDLPPGYTMVFGSAPPFIGWKMVAFGDARQNPKNTGMIMLFPKSMNVSQMETQMNQQAQKGGAGGGKLTEEDSSEETITVGGQETKLVRKIMVNQNSGGRVLQYTFMLTRPNGTIMVVFQGPADDFDEPAWDAFVSSIQ
jgi:hypothetical protein